MDKIISILKDGKQSKNCIVQFSSLSGRDKFTFVCPLDIVGRIIECNL